MRIVFPDDKVPPLPKPYALTIGSFDGVHLGHQALIRRLRDKVGEKGSIALFTYSNHPSDVLKNRPPARLLCTPEHKLLLLEKSDLDIVFLQPFTHAFSQKPFEDFLTELHGRFPFSFLVVGTGTTFGKDKKGDEQHVSALGKKMGFIAEYVNKTEVNGEIVSSGAIRKCLEHNDIAKASAFLGRPYSIYARYAAQGIPLTGLCHLPTGTYPVTVKHYSGTATLNSHLVLDLPSCHEDLDGQFLEVIFQS